MNYPDGQKVELGDKIRLWDGCRGVVVALIDEDEFADDYKKADWSYLEQGALIESDAAGLIHQMQPDEDWKLVERPPQVRRPARVAS